MQAIVKYFLVPFVCAIPQLAFHIDDICIHIFKKAQAQFMIYNYV